MRKKSGFSCLEKMGRGMTITNTLQDSQGNTDTSRGAVAD